MSPLTKRTKEFKTIAEEDKQYTLKAAIELLKNAPPTKFDQTVDMSFKVAVDVKEASVSIRGTVGLPHGTGRDIRVVVFCKGDAEKKSLAAGANFAGAEELVNKVAAGWCDFDVAIATPDMMKEMSKLGKVLGPRGLMPSPKAGTVTTDVETVIKDIKKGKIEFKMDKQANVHAPIGKLSFDTVALYENGASLIDAVVAAKPAIIKAQYLKSIAVSSTMGPGIKLDINNWR